MMMEAAVNNRKAIIKLLDSFGADINAADRHGSTALHAACRYGYEGLAEYMVKKLGADDTVLDAKGRSCYEVTRQSTSLTPTTLRNPHPGFEISPQPAAT